MKCSTEVLEAGMRTRKLRHLRPTRHNRVARLVAIGIALSTFSELPLLPSNKKLRRWLAE